MRSHQRYFAVADPATDKLLPHFVAVCNIAPKDLDVVIKGNERVLRARLRDARFFFDEDLKIPIDEHVESLKTVVFQEKLGTSHAKTIRNTKLAVTLAARLCPDEVETVKRAAHLAKADLVTEMVGEFPDLQGVMGGVYATRGGESEAIAHAIYEHYMPVSAGGAIPETATAACLAIADRLDTIVGCFGIGLAPTGTQDPYGLRRKALGIIRICTGKGYSMPLEPIVGLAADLLSDTIEVNRDEVIAQVIDFHRLRLRHLIAAEGVELEMIDAALNVRFDDILDGARRIEALSRFRSGGDFPAVATAFKRVANIVAEHATGTVTPGLFVEEAERRLFAAWQEMSEKSRPLVEQGRYLDALTAMAVIRPAVDTFFDDVMVMVEDAALRDNRLALLGEINRFFRNVADFRAISSAG